MSITSESGWNELEAKARHHELEQAYAKAGLPLVRVTVTDRKNGAIVTAMAQLKAGDSLAAYQTLQNGLEL